MVGAAWKGKDHPRTLDLDLGDKVALTISDYDEYGVESPNAVAEWKSVFPIGNGFVHLGPDKRRFGLSMFHQVRLPRPFPFASESLTSSVDSLSANDSRCNC